MSNLSTRDIKEYFLKYKEETKSHLEKIYLNKKHLLIKISIFLLVGFLIFLISFLTRDAMLNATQTSWILIPNFLDIKIIENTGISFGSLSQTSPGVVYFVQSLPIIIGFIAFIFSSHYFLDVGISMLFFAGMSNIIDRSLPDVYINKIMATENDAVVDYFQFSFIKDSAIFNFPDVFITISVGLICLHIIIAWVKEYKKESAKEKNKLVKEHVHDETRNNKPYKTIKTIKTKK
ncbi:MAG: signal peptidase II [Malacoplasma sp.]|nr:signal peptidase II [Malacoplasma sp.]